MGKRIRVNFVSLLDGKDGKEWRDGMWAAHQRLEDYDFHYYYPNENFLEENPDILAAWGGAFSNEAKVVSEANHPRKVLFHAGGDFKSGYLRGFNLLFVEWPNEISNLEAQGLPYKIAFGTNEKLFTPQSVPKLWDACYPCAYAAWKRHNLFAEAVGAKGLTCGTKQKVETYCYEYPEEKGCTVLPNLPMSFLSYIYSASFCTLVTASYFGGSQRTILEGMACGIPSIVMDDAGRNKIYVEQSGLGFIVPPEVKAIKEAVEKIKATPPSPELCRKYVLDNWSSAHYAKAIDEGLKNL